MKQDWRLGPNRARAVALVVVGAMVGLAAGCGSGSGFCSTHACIGNFDNGRGYIVQCADSEWSHSGGDQGACSDHGGER
jgi:hypothetical protein